MAGTIQLDQAVPGARFPQRMESLCASPDLFFEVSPSEGISDAMTTLFNKIVNTPLASPADPDRPHATGKH
jgi:hypothetical protein